MNNASDIEQRLIDLEVKLGFTEDLVDELNKIVVRQQQQIERLLRELSALQQQATDQGTGTWRSLRDELPPHY